MAKSQQTFNKKEREKKRRKKKEEKRERREMRKIEKAEAGKKTFEEQIVYLDHDGNYIDTPPDPKMKKVIKAENIPLGVPMREHVPMETTRAGKVKFFNPDKGYGFITDKQTKDNIFVHINDAQEELKENYIVTFEIGKGPKGMIAKNVIVVRN